MDVSLTFWGRVPETLIAGIISSNQHSGALSNLDRILHSSLVHCLLPMDGQQTLNPGEWTLHQQCPRACVTGEGCHMWLLKGIAWMLKGKIIFLQSLPTCFVG